MQTEPIKPKKVVFLSGKRTDPPYSLRIQIVQHPAEQDVKRIYALHRFPYGGSGETICLSMYGSRCPVCDAIQLGGEPFPRWNAGVKKFVMFYGVCLNNQFVRDQSLVNAGEMVLWIMLENDYKFIDQIISQRRSSAYKSTSYIFDLAINPSADFQKFERRCTFSFAGESQIDLGSLFMDSVQPLSVLSYSSKFPNDIEMNNLIAAYVRMPNKKIRTGESL